MTFSTNGCRIGRVKMKGGAEVRVLETKSNGNPEIIEVLINLLDSARNGELVAIGIISVNDERMIGTQWIHGDEDDYHRLCSGALHLVHRLGEP